ncbi:unnamed protein product [Echinostoma caproni]|uniref:Fanconi_A_N domain-containing protein n=1 Tax=Echinostoma caproni TaxID=27848 RepID=A0A183BAX3_9TREM|nr:unnamed protein product [Echinostoma caproni]
MSVSPHLDFCTLIRSFYTHCLTFLTDLIRKILISVFQPMLSREYDDEFSTDAFELLPDDVSSEETKLKLPSTNALSDWDRFSFALLLARQLSAEDVRVTGFTYTQWWMETFCSVTNTTSSILKSRADVTLLAKWLIDLLPWENDPRSLQIQLTHKPTWPIHPTGSKKAGNPSAVPVMDRPEDSFLLLDTEVAMAELESMDAQSRDCCVQCWNDYVEIARGRLAELRERTPDVHSVDSLTSLGVTAAVATDCSSTPGWCEVCAWIDEIRKQLPVNNPSEASVDAVTCAAISEPVTLRIPQSFTEANLFQPRKLRTVLIPALLGAPELASLSESQTVAREHLISSIRRAGLGSLLDSSNEVSSDQDNKRAGSRWTRLTSLKQGAKPAQRSATSKRIPTKGRPRRPTKTMK